MPPPSQHWHRVTRLHLAPKHPALEKHTQARRGDTVPRTPRRGILGCPLSWGCRSPALAGRCGSPGDTVFLCSAGCCGERSRGSVSDEVTRDWVTSELPGLLNCSVLWLVTGTVTGMAKFGAGTAD